jgi:hypothetical protein
MRTVLTLLVVLLTSHVVRSEKTRLPAERSPSHPQVRHERAEVAILTLRAARFFAIGGVGYGGAISDEERALLELVAAKNVRALENLLREPNRATKLYALVDYGI